MLSYSPKLYAQALYQLAKNQSLSTLPALAANFLAILERHGRRRQWPLITRMLDELDRNKRRVLRVRIESARRLTPANQKLVCQALEDRFPGRSLEIDYRVDERLLGGLRIEADGLVIDGSLKRILEKFIYSEPTPL